MRVINSILAGVLILVLAGAAEANIEHMKEYKKAYPESKAKCSACHVSDKPKKQDGQHDLNAYGEKVKGLGEMTEEKLLEIGSYEDWKAESGE